MLFYTNHNSLLCLVGPVQMNRYNITSSLPVSPIWRCSYSFYLGIILPRIILKKQHYQFLQKLLCTYKCFPVLKIFLNKYPNLLSIFLFYKKKGLILFAIISHKAVFLQIITAFHKINRLTFLFYRLKTFLLFGFLFFHML